MKHPQILLSLGAALLAACAESPPVTDLTATVAASNVAAAASDAAAAASNVAAGTSDVAAGTSDVAVSADSALPMDSLIARFQAAQPRATSLGRDAPRSIDELVSRFATAVADSSVAALAALTLDQAEFAHLYFPSSIYVRPPYAQPPAINWLLMEQNSLKGRHRLLRDYGGRPFSVQAYDCTGDPVSEGHNRIHEQCTLQIRSGSGPLEKVRLFGSVIERDGRYKLMSLANRL